MLQNKNDLSHRVEARGRKKDEIFSPWVWHAPLTIYLIFGELLPIQTRHLLHIHRDDKRYCHRYQ